MDEWTRADRDAFRNHDLTGWGFGEGFDPAIFGKPITAADLAAAIPCPLDKE